jgi:hypothetical protein
MGWWVAVETTPVQDCRAKLEFEIELSSKNDNDIKALTEVEEDRPKEIEKK